ncbi:MAG: hypothetical protein ACOYNS_16775 [Bacteroidota bacterium]
MRFSTDTITDWILFGGVFSAPILLAETDCSFLILTSFFCIPLHLVSAASAYFAVLWFTGENGFLNGNKESDRALFPMIAEGMIIPVMFYCGLLLLFSEQLSAIILYGSASYLISLSVLFLRNSVRSV